MHRRLRVAKGEKKGNKSDVADLVSGTLNIFGIKLDLGKMVGSPESLVGQMEELRERLKKAGGKEVLSDDEWRQGKAVVSGHIRTGGALGEREFHVGTMGNPARNRAGASSTEPAEVAEPPVDVFVEGEQVTVVADIPGVSMDDLEVSVEGDKLILSTKATARRRYRKEVALGTPVRADSLEVSIRNGVLEARIKKRGSR